MRFRSIALCAALASGSAFADRLPEVASINLCTDQLVLSLADRAQIVTLSWLSADPEESMLADEAREFPLNYGSAEELLGFAPDVIVSGTFTNAFSRRLMRELGFNVVEVAPAVDLDGIARNLRQVGAAIDRAARAEELIESMHRHASLIAEQRPAKPVATVVVRPGGYTVGANTLADELMTLAGLRNVAAEHGLDRWGSLSMEALLRVRPELIVLTDYRLGERSLANSIFGHPALVSLSRQTRSANIPAKHWACATPESLRSAELLLRSLRSR